MTVQFDLTQRPLPLSAASPVASAGERRTDLDWLRIAAFGILILFHVSMFYAPAEWELKSTRVLPWLTVVLEWSAPWRLLLLFAVSGAATAFMLRRLDPAQLFRTRSAFLLPPLLFAALVVVPPQVYFEVVEEYGFTGGFWRFLTYYYTGGLCQAGHCHMMPHWEHMWFVAYLWIYTTVLAGLLVLWKGLPDHLDRLAHRFFLGPNLLFVPALGLGLAHASLGYLFPETHGLTDDWYLHATFFAAFLFGFTCLGNRQTMHGLEALRWVALALAITAYACRSGYTWHYRGGPSAPFVLKVTLAFVYGIDQWAWLVAAFGFAHHWLSGRDGPLRRYLTEAIFPYYIIHQTAIVVVAYEVSKLRLPLALEATAIVAGCVVSCVLTFELVRGVRWLRPWFGLKPSRARSAAEA